MSKFKDKASHAFGAGNIEKLLMAKAMAGDMVLVVTPATVAPVPTAAAWKRKVTVSLKTANGEVHTWFNGNVTVGIGDTSALGTATIPSTTLALVNGVGTVEISGNAAAWLAGETETLTLSNKVIMGQTVAGATSVATFA